MKKQECRLCGVDMSVLPIPDDMEECHGCYEVYSRLRFMPLSLIKKLLMEAGVDIPKLIEKLKEE